MTTVIRVETTLPARYEYPEDSDWRIHQSGALTIIRTNPHGTSLGELASFGPREWRHVQRLPDMEKPA